MISVANAHFPDAAYWPDPALGAGFVSGLGFGAGRETPMLSKTNPKPFLSVARKLMVPTSLLFPIQF
jgi:hypothetical protein